MRNIFIALVLGVLVLPMMSIATPAEADDGRMSIVVLEPSVNFKYAVHKLGYRVGTMYELKELEMRAVNVLAPKGHSIDAAILELEMHFPDILVADSEI
jgi:hypothetical protein